MTHDDVVTAVHAALDAALVSPIEWAVGKKERFRNERPPRIVWDDSEADGTVGAVKQSNGEPHALYSDVRSWQVVIWGTSRVQAEQLFHALLTSARVAYGRETIRCTTYRMSPEGYVSKGAAIVARFDTELLVTNLIHIDVALDGWSGKGVILPSEEVVVGPSEAIIVPAP